MSGPNGPQQTNDPGAPAGGVPQGPVGGAEAATQQFTNPAQAAGDPTQQFSNPAQVPAGEQPTQVWAAPPQAEAPQAYSQAGYPPPQQQWGQQQAYSAPGYPEQGYQQPVYGQQQYPQQGYPQQQGVSPQQYGQAAYPAPEQTMGDAAAAPAPTTSPKKSKGKLFAIVGGAAAIVIVVVLLLGFVWPGFFQAKTLDRTAAENGVKQVLTNSYGASVSAVSCPSGVKVEQGATFTCEVTIDGSTQKVTSTFTDNSGTYEVARPSGS